MEKTTTEKHPRTFAIIGTPDGSRRLWLSRPTEAGHIYVTCSFALTGRMAFVDSIDALDYIRVDRVITYDEDISALQLTLLQDPKDCLERLMEDLPGLMEEHLATKRRELAMSSRLLDALAAEVEREHLPVSIRRGTPYTDENGTETVDAVVELRGADSDFNAVLSRVVNRYIHQG